MQNSVKSSSVAGILGVFLGAFGAHDWYLGNTKRAITHVSLCVGGFILLILGVILTNLSRDIPVFNVLFVCLIVAAYVILVGNGVWGFIEGVIILAQGDAGLAARGYQVAGGAEVNEVEGVAGNTDGIAGASAGVGATGSASVSAGAGVAGGNVMNGVKNFFSPKAAANEDAKDKAVLAEASKDEAAKTQENAESLGGLKTENRVNDVPQLTISTPGVAASETKPTEAVKPVVAGASEVSSAPATPAVQTTSTQASTTQASPAETSAQTPPTQTPPAQTPPAAS